MSDTNLWSPVLPRLFAFEEDGHARDDLLAGLIFATTPTAIGKELRGLAESGKKELALELCSQLLTFSVPDYDKYYLLAYAAMWSDQLGQVDRGLDYACEAYALLEPLNGGGPRLVMQSTRVATSRTRRIYRSARLGRARTSTRSQQRKPEQHARFGALRTG
jgi:hypothetical protein